MVKLYSDPTDPCSHRARIVLSEKELPIDITDVELNEEDIPQDLLDLNPSGDVPTIADREAVLFDPFVINEYLDERYPHPPLKPGSPAERAKMRLAVKRIETELYPLYANLMRVKKKTEPMRKMRAYLDALNTYMSDQEFFVSDCYTLADITLAPILWRLAPLGLDMSRWPALESYMDRLFERPAFERSLSEHEQMLHQ